MVERRRLIRAGLVARMKETTVLCERPEDGDHHEEIDICVIIILQLILGRYDGLVRAELICLG